jgi:hypothetical protein
MWYTTSGYDFIKIKIVSRDVSGISQARKSGKSPSEDTVLTEAL